MRLEALAPAEVCGKAQGQVTGGIGGNVRLLERSAALSEILETLLFGESCFECNRMSAIPQSAFAAIKVRENFERTHPSNSHEEEEPQKGAKNCGFNAKVLQEGRELTPLKYNSKLMNSIWGLYNRYSVHNFKQIGANDTSLLAEACWGAIHPGAAAEAVVAEGRGPAARIIGATGH